MIPAKIAPVHEASSPHPTQGPQKEDRDSWSPSGPVTWLLGQDLLAGLQKILLYTLVGKKFPGMAWMRPAVERPQIPPPDPGGANAEHGVAGVAAAGPESRADANEPDVFWFDYISDSGDSQMATYSLAYLCLNDLRLDKDQSIKLVGDPKSPGVTAGPEVLPRGRFLLFGGDTAYHVADYATLVERIWTPFNRAYRHAKEDDFNSGWRRTAWLFGIPGNHDYYDQLDGFGRQFREPLSQQLNLGANDLGGRVHPPQLELASFVRKQHASYVALELPHGWKLCALDLQEGRLDYRQELFFRHFLAQRNDRLIVASPEPATVFRRTDERIRDAFERLGLDEPLTAKKAGVVPSSSCRLDLAGDVHHYARYWGPPPEAPDEGNQGAPTSTNYASVVSGLGGAFLHPPETVHGDRVPQLTFPKVKKSQEAVYPRLLNPWHIARGGSLWIVGALVAGLLYFCALVPGGTLQLLSALPRVKTLLPGFANPCSHTQEKDPNILFSLRCRMEILADPSRMAQPPPAAQSTPKDDLFRLFLQRLNMPWIDWALCLVLLVLFGSSWGIEWSKTRRPQRSRTETHSSKSQGHARGTAGEGGDTKAPQVRDFTQLDLLSSWVLMGLAALGVAVIFCQFLMEEGAPRHGPLREALLMMVFFALAGLSFYRRAGYRERLAAQARLSDEQTAGDRWYGRVLVIFAILCFYVGIWRYGQYPAVVLLTHAVFLVLGLGLPLGLAFWAALYGAKDQSRKRKVLFGVVGLVQGLLQAVVPLLWARLAPWELMAAAVCGITVITVLCVRCERCRSKWVLLGVYLVLGIGLCALPLVFDKVRAVDSTGLILACGIGLCAAPFLFGWYLAVSLAFDGHNNEAGGAARIEKFKQFIRIKLEKDKLTAYVIGFEDPKKNGKDLVARLIEQFVLEPSSGCEPKGPTKSRLTV